VPNQWNLVIDRLKKELFNLGRFEEIIKICENILEHDPKNIGARLTLAELNEKKGDLKATADILQGIIDDYPDDLLSLLELTRICLEKGDRKRVDELLRTLEHKRELLKKNSQDQSDTRATIPA
jgi:tetratricopeptide (TPR) repeat protein